MESCTQCTNNGYVDSIQYSLTADGHADGQLGVEFPNGKFQSNGDVDLLFEIENDTTKLLSSGLTLEKGLAANDLKEREAAEKVSDELGKITITSLDGHYLVHLKGYAKEPVTGLVFMIDKTYTNLPQ